jgi:FixJ family two-component response regulator
MDEKRAVVFVIDDDPSMRGALGNLIASVGLDVRLFASPHEFLASERPNAPGCLVLDVRLQGMTGLAFHEELVKTASRCL